MPLTVPSGSGDLLAANNLSDVANAATSFSNIKQTATTSATGVAETATLAEVNTGTDTTRYVTPQAIAENIFNRGYIFGCTLSNNGTDATNDIDIAAGICADSASPYRMIELGALTKRLDAAWAVGTGNGGLDTGSIANVTYHVWAIRRSDTGVADVLFSESVSAPTMPTNYDQKRRIGSIIRSGATILGFVQDGNLFQLKASILDVDSTNPGTSAVTRTLSVPTGINVLARMNVAIASGLSNPACYLSDLSVNDEASSITAAPLGQHRETGASSTSVTGVVEVRSNTSAQIRSRLSASDSTAVLRIAMLGWWDRRGQDT